MSAIDQYLESHAARFEDELCEFLRIPSVSADPNRRDDMHRAAEWVADQFRRMRFADRGDPHGRPSAGLRRVAGRARRPDGPGLRPLRRAAGRAAGKMDHAPLRADPPRRQPLRPRRHRRQGPDVHAPEERRGLDHRRGPAAAEPEVPHRGRGGGRQPRAWRQYLAEHADRLACDCVVISDGGQFAPGMPAITYGLRGIAYYELRVTGPNRDLHSGSFGGSVTNPANALAKMLAGLIDDQGRVTIPGFYDDVVPLTDRERQGDGRAAVRREGVFQAASA